MQNSTKMSLNMEHNTILYWISVHQPTSSSNRLSKYIITSYIWNHKDSIRIGEKKVLLKLVKSPIGAKKTFQIYEDAHELAKSDIPANKWLKEIRSMLFFGEKEGGWCGKKTRQLLLD